MNEEKVISSHVSRPVRVSKKEPAVRSFAESMLPYFPDLKKKLSLANMRDSPSAFLEKAILASVYISLGLTILAGMFLHIIYMNVLFSIIFLPFFFAGTFGYMLMYPEAKIIGRQRDVDSELVFAGRHVLIGLRAGMPLFDCLVGASSGYHVVSEEFRKIVDKINLGVPMGQAFREAGAASPSKSFARITMQIANAISSGADVANSLESVLNQIAREQAISLKAYGQKLNPIMMFFMIFGIIFPTLGVAFAIILLSLVSGGAIGINSTSLIYVLAFIGIVQFIFLSIVESSRPKFVL